MSAIKLYRGGTGVEQFPFCDDNYSKFGPPFAGPHIDLSPPFDSHACAAYDHGYFTLGMPIAPTIMEWQKKAFKEKLVAVGDIIECVWVPEYHWPTSLSFTVTGDDAQMAGATVAITSETITRDASGAYVYTENPQMAAALTAGGVPAAIAIDKETTGSNENIARVSYYVPLMRVASGVEVDVSVNTDTGAGSGEGTGDGFVMPLLYSAPGTIHMIGLRIVSLPTAEGASFAAMRNRLDLSVKIEGFDSPCYL